MKQHHGLIIYWTSLSFDGLWLVETKVRKELNYTERKIREGGRVKLARNYIIIYFLKFDIDLSIPKSLSNTASTNTFDLTGTLKWL